MIFTDRLHEKTLPIWRQNHNHPFVKGIGDGTVNQKNFRFYMVQDYLYLTDYSEVVSEGKPEHELQKLEEIFLNTTRFEYMFWDMANNKQMWPGAGTADVGV